MLILTYVNFLPIPWRFAILVDAWGDACAKKVDPPGLDFYGRPTEALWFHIDRHQRAVIAFFLSLACWMHIASVGFQCYYWPYIETQTWPGVVAINVPGALSIISAVTAGVLQARAEKKLIAEQPERFPPAIAKYLREAWSEWHSGTSGMVRAPSTRPASLPLACPNKPWNGGGGCIITRSPRRAEPEKDDRGQVCGVQGRLGGQGRGRGQVARADIYPGEMPSQPMPGHARGGRVGRRGHL